MTNSTALKVVTEAQLPVAANFNLSAEDRDALRDDYLETVWERYKNIKSDVNFFRAIAGGSAVIAGTVGVLFPPCGIPFGVMAVAVAAGGGSIQKRLNNIGDAAMRKTEKDTWRRFEKKQKEFYNGQKKQIAKAADIHLGNGNLLTLEDAAWLGNLDGEALREATDQLAITVHQIRRMLAYQRCQTFSSDGSKDTAPPMTFASTRLDRDFPLHRTWLREKLRGADWRIAEDAYPETKVNSMTTPQVPHKYGYWRSVVDFVTPFSAKRRLRQFNAAAMPVMEDAEIQTVQPIADFAEALRDYESKNAPLDLPAVRGWKGPQRRALTAPKTF